jgi:dienelactone hydrolase
VRPVVGASRKQVVGLCACLLVALWPSGWIGPASGAESAPAAPGTGDSRRGSDVRVVLESDGWRLVGEWRAPSFSGPWPAALLLHRAAGSRDEYVDLAGVLAGRGVASLRLDLRACGESDNLGRFEEPFAENLHHLEGSYRDVDAALRWIRGQPAVAADRIAVVGASYSGEAIGEALRKGGEKAAAYVVLSPGSFSDESIAAVAAGGAAWLFIRTRGESEASLQHIDAVFEAIAEGAAAAEIRVLPGAGHATRMFETHPSIIGEIGDWIATRLGPG